MSQQEPVKGRFVDKYPLTETELKILMLIASKVKKEDNLEEKTYKFDIQQVRKAIGLPESEDYEDLAAVTKKMIGKYFLVEGKTSTVYLKWLAAASYDLHEKTVAFSILPELKDVYSYIGQTSKLSDNLEIDSGIAKISQIFEK